MIIAVIITKNFIMIKVLQMDMKITLVRIIIIHIMIQYLVQAMMKIQIKVKMM